MDGLVQRAALALLSVLMAVGCVNAESPPDDTRNPYLPLAALKAEEASTLAMPGAERLRPVSGERFMNITGPEPSFVGAVYGIPGTQADTFAFYDRELLRLGWQRARDPIPASGEKVTRGWCKPQMYFRLAIYDPERYARTGIEGGERFATVFDASIVATGDLPCPNLPTTTFPPRSPSRTP